MKTMLIGALALAGAVCAVPANAQTLGGPEAQPLPPAGASANQFIPAHDAAGGYLTLNHGLSTAETSWHLRAALNVAALGCRDAAERETVAAYNLMLARHRVPLAAADLGVKAQYRTRYGAGWDSHHDSDMTRLYNFFAQPPAQPGFCHAAQAVLAEAVAVEPAGFDAFAAGALPRLEAPFTDFYRDYEAWRIADSAWRARLASVRP
jgi:hypothetical protein